MACKDQIVSIAHDPRQPMATTPLPAPLVHPLLACSGGNRFLFGYSGAFPDEHSARLIELVEVMAARDQSLRSGKGRLAFILVEAYQNIIRHQAISATADPWGAARPMFLIQDQQGMQVMTTRNAVSHKQAEALRTQLAELVRMEDAALKELLLQGIQRPSTTGVRGAGLGLIGMLRRTGEKPTWTFAPVDKEHQAFSLHWALDHWPKATTTGGEMLLDLPAWMSEHRVQLCYAGPWTADLGTVLLRLAGAEWPHSPAGPDGHDQRLQQLAEAVLPVFSGSGQLAVALHGGSPMRLTVGGLVAHDVPARWQGRWEQAEWTLGPAMPEPGGGVLASVSFPW
ncbi:MAG: hypothetical protein IT230_08485 [Flavobacteriales bacterium]|nr:hypothetical protein [Flavobacteriales bacterium]